ncbi:MAG TPA: peptidylprolyl isomerase [Gammaproteobacteria bacterium]|nr:peptidylprolyl isomerase [Gammaproteobacteria bacterium]
MRKTALMLAVLALAGLALSGCHGKDESNAASAGSSNGTSSGITIPAGSGSVATVNGQPVSKTLFQLFANQREQQSGKKLSDQERDDLVNQLVDLELLAQDAKKKGLEQQPDVQGQLLAQYLTTLARAAVQDHIKNVKISESEIQKAYKQRVAHMSGKEYKARHILLKTKAGAEAVIKQLDKGANFAKLAKEKSTGPSASQGGQLGWFAPEDMVPHFSQALEKLKPGHYTEKPVKTRFGWHVILLEATRNKKKPSLDDLRDQIKQTLQRQKVDQYIQQLRKKADIKRG